ncbi:MAG: HAD family hydrolase [Spirochaetales bacterium]|nr:HAD family hydrolase [Spirochaetales bacterium]
MKLNFFFDIDGTIVPFGKAIPQSTVDAIQYAKSLGHRVFLSTGRATFEVQDDVNELPFDGGVFSAGSELRWEGRQVFKHHASEQQRKLFFDVVKKYNLLWLIQGRENTYGTTRSVEYYEKLCYEVDGGIVPLKNLKIVDAFPDSDPIMKFFILSENGKVLDARRELDGLFETVNNTTGFPPESAAEIMIAGSSKSNGIIKLVSLIGDDMKSTVGIGDGENDLGMIDVCNLGIAMGNACQILKDHADYVTDTIDNDGLAKAIYYAIDNLKQEGI